MKKTISAVLVCALLVCTLLSLVSCGKMFMGTYKYEGLTQNITYEFKLGGKVVRTIDPILGDNIVDEGEYEINSDASEITLTFGDESSTHSFVEGKEGDVKYIKIDIMQFNEVK